MKENHFFMKSVELNEDKSLHVVFERKVGNRTEIVDIPKMEIRELDYDGINSTATLLVFPFSDEGGYSIKMETLE